MKESNNNIESSNTGKHLSVWKIFFFSCLVLLIIGFILIHSGILRHSGINVSNIVPVQNYEEKQLDIDALQMQINLLDKEYQDDCNRYMIQYLEFLEFKVEPDFQKAKKNIPDVIDKLTNLSVCVKFSYKAAKDKLKGTNDFEDAYMDVMKEPIIQPCFHANVLATEMLQTLNQHLKERYAKLTMDLAVVCGETNNAVPSPDVERLLQCINDVSSTSTQLQQEKLIALVGVAFEAVFIRSTCNAIVKLFAGPVAKICGSLGVGGVCAAADGPFPVGDAIGGVLAVGGLAWTAYDIYDVTCVMPERLKDELTTGINETQKKLLDDTRNKAQDLVKSYQNSGVALKNELTKEM